MTIESTLAERESTYGSFTTHSNISQALLLTMTESDNWEELTATHKEALQMIAHKMARVLNGDPDYADNWHDIAGYATLAEKHCEVGS